VLLVRGVRGRGFRKKEQPQQEHNSKGPQRLLSVALGAIGTHFVFSVVVGWFAFVAWLVGWLVGFRCCFEQTPDDRKHAVLLRWCVPWDGRKEWGRLCLCVCVGVSVCWCVTEAFR